MAPKRPLRPVPLLAAAAVLSVAAVLALVLPSEKPRAPAAAAPAPVTPPPAAAPSAPEIDPATGLLKAEGWELVAANCTACHSARLVTQNRGDREHWRSMIRWMQQTQNLWPLAPPIEEKILAYLSEHYAAQGFSRRAPLEAHLLPPEPGTGLTQGSK